MERAKMGTQEACRGGAVWRWTEISGSPACSLACQPGPWGPKSGSEALTSESASSSWPGRPLRLPSNHRMHFIQNHGPDPTTQTQTQQCFQQVRNRGNPHRGTGDENEIEQRACKTYLYPAFSAGQTPGFCPPLDLLSARNQESSNSQPLDFFCTSCWGPWRRAGTFLCLPPLKAMRGS